MSDTAPVRLPRSVVPERYELTLTPDLAARTFTGEELVAVEVREAVTELVLNVNELDVHRAELVAVCDPDIAKAEDRAREFGVKRTWRDGAAMLAAEALDAVDVASPRRTHGWWIEAALARVDGNVSEAWKALGMSSRDALNRLIKKLGIEQPRARRG